MMYLYLKNVRHLLLHTVVMVSPMEMNNVMVVAVVEPTVLDQVVEDDLDLTKIVVTARTNHQVTMMANVSENLSILQHQ